MDQTTDSSAAPFEPASKPSLWSQFFRGAASGAFNGALIMGIFTGLTLTASLIALSTAAPAFLGIHAFTTLAAFAEGAIGPAIVGTLTTGLFSGVMAVKRAWEDAPTAAPMRDSELASNVMVPMMGAAAQPSLDVADDAAPTTAQAAKPSWTERTGSRNSNRIQQIIADGAMSDKARASAILAERQQAAANTTSVA